MPSRPDKLYRLLPKRVGHIGRKWEMNPYWQRELIKKVKIDYPPSTSSRFAWRFEQRKILATIHRKHVKTIRDI